MKNVQIMSLAMLLVACGVETKPNPRFDAGHDAASGTGGTGGVGGGGSGGTGGVGGTGGDDLDAGEDSGIDADSGPVCGVTCDGETPYCDETSMTCLACLESADCDGNDNGSVCVDGACVECTSTEGCVSPEVCVSGGNECVACNVEANCTGDDKCKSDNTCVQCLVDSDCNSAGAAKCDLANNTCVPCDNNVQCEGVMDGARNLGVCSAGACVECTATEFTACGTAPNNRQNVCDALSKTCTAFDTNSAGLCVPCVSNAQCRDGQVCVEQTYGEDPVEHVGYFCFWRRESTQQGAPNGMCASVPPYFGSANNVATIDGPTASICRPALTTCPGLNDFRSVNCAPTGTPDDALCGYDHSAEGLNGNLKDAYCRPLDDQDLSQGYRCTVPCGSSDDCDSGFSCLSDTPKVCSFQ